MGFGKEPENPERRSFLEKALYGVALVTPLAYLLGVRRCVGSVGSTEGVKKKQATETKEVPGGNYLGTWKYRKSQDYMKFSASKSKPTQALELNGHKAVLLIPVHLRFYVKRELFGGSAELEMYSVAGGIYKVDGKQDAFIGKVPVFEYLIVGLKKVDQKNIKATGKETGEYNSSNWKWHNLKRVGVFKGIKK